MNIRRLTQIGAFALLGAFIGTASATHITLSGLTFDDHLGTGVTITGGIAGAGTEADPIVLFEDVTGLDVTIGIAGLASFGNQTGSSHLTGFYLKKVVTNLTGVDWNFYDHELQEQLGVPSPDGDGLSFAQGCAACRPWVSDKFASYNEIIDVRDFVNFSNGIVLAGETVTFLYAITDNSPNDEFWLRQRPNYQVPEPATLALFGLGLLGIGFAGKRKTV